MIHPTKTSLFALVLAAACADAYAQKPVRSDARAEARAEARSDGTGDKTHSVTHRVVVVNGKKIVDERTENGRPVGAGGRRGKLPPKRTPPVRDAREMLRQMKERLERELGRDLPLGGFDEPLPRRRGADAADRRAEKTTPEVGPRRADERRKGRLQPRRRLR